ncbi:AfsR/SARP family transcriptional regulator [Amycolatopsis suaedae]|uniref:AfsR/SARP family transcriptional regulator n=1 Tax=Amycolatopsis suaedae TaxID=2510978 RepID=UPI0013EF2562|nr:BTAD domain-containing putative transcriptional regulator [Amycolatopsis suaedae]
MRVEFFVLGPLRVEVGGEAVPVPGGKVAALLAALLARPGELVPIRQLAHWMWDEDGPRDPRSAIQTNVRRLRDLVGTATVRTGQGGYTLAVTAESLDVLRFRELVEAAHRADAAGRLDEAAGLLETALGLWRGPAYADVESPVLRQEEAPHLDEERLRAGQFWADVRCRLGQYDLVTTTLSRLVSEHPVRESLSEMLIRALYRAGRRPDALAEYRRLAHALAEAQGLDPSPGVQRLHEAILADAPEAEVPAATVPAQLPAAPGRFTGRTAELAQLDEQLAGLGEAGVTVVVLAGTPGAGKTALAVHWAHQHVHRFPDGQLYVNLRGWGPSDPLRPIEALAGFLGALGVRPDAVPTDQDQAAALYRSLLTGRRVLVVLDNAADPEQVRPLLPGHPQALVLVTSRSRLRGLVVTHAAHRIDVGMLPAGDAVDLLAMGLGERGGHTAHLAPLAARCAGLPLALRIAAADLAGEPGLRLDDYLARLSRHRALSTLTSGDDPATAVRTLFEHSYARLPPAAQRLFRLLGLVPGADLTAAAAAALTGSSPGRVLELLRTLVQAHLLTEHVPGRFCFHDLLRAYADECAYADETPAARDQALRGLLDWYLESADNAVSRMDPAAVRAPTVVGDPVRPAEFDSHTEARSWLDAERDNLVAIVLSGQNGGFNDHAWRIGFTLRAYLQREPQVVVWLESAQAVLAAASVIGDPLPLGAAMTNLAHLHLCTGELDQSAAFAERALPLLRQSGWSLGELVVLVVVGLASQHAGKLRAAAGYHREALELAAGSGRALLEAGCLHNLATVSELLGDLAGSVGYARRALVIATEHGDDAGRALSLFSIGTAEHQRGHFAEAGENLTEAARLSAELSYSIGRMMSTIALSRLYRDRGRYARAREYADTGVALAVHSGDRPREVRALNARASIDLRCGDLAAARERFRQALRVADRSGIAQARVETLIGLAAVDRCLGDPDVARSSVAEALRAAGEIGCRGFEVRALIELAEIGFATGEAAAREHAEQALSLSEETGQRVVRVDALDLLSRIARQRADSAAAAAYRREAERLAADIGLPAAGVSVV